MAKTELSGESIRTQHASFLEECPSGEMSKAKFVELSEVIFQLIGQEMLYKRPAQKVLGEEAQFLADTLFRVFDDDGSGTMDFQEYILALNATRYKMKKKKLSFA